MFIIILIISIAVNLSVINRTFALFVCVLSLSSCGFCLNPFLVSSANYTIFYDYSIDVSHGSASDIALNISIPTGSNVILCSNNYSIQKDSLSNEYFSVNEKNPKLPFVIQAYLSVQSNASSIPSLPISGSYEIPLDYVLFLKCDSQIDCNDEQFKQIALNTTSNFEGDFEKISALAYWVNSNIDYDLSYVGKNMSASQIFSTGKGVCTDFSTMFATLARSLGYPTRFVNGYAYSTVQEKWVGHAWNEVYIGKWVGVDSTWLEVGAIDATHVALVRCDKNVHSLASVSAMVSPSSAQIIWGGVNDLNDLSANNLKLESSQFFQPFTNYELFASHSKLTNSSKFLVYLKYSANDYRLLRAKLFACVSDNGDIIRFDNEDAWVATKPNSISYLVWSASVSTQIDKNVLYKCPISLNSDTLMSDSIIVELDSNDYQSEKISASVLYPIIASSQVQTVIVNSSHNSKQQKTKSSNMVYLLSENSIQKKPFDSNGIATFDFVVYGAGKKQVYIWTENSAPIVLDYITNYSKGENHFTISFGSSYIMGKSSTINFDFENGFNSVSNISSSNHSYLGHTLVWQWGLESGSASLENITKNNSILKLNFVPKSDGNNVFSASIYDSKHQKLYSQSRNLYVYPISNVSVVHVSLTQIAINSTIVRLLLNSSDSVENVWVMVDGKKYVVLENEIQMNLLPKPYAAKIFWTDMNDQQYSLPLFIRAPIEQEQAQIFAGIIVQKSTLDLIKVLATAILGLGLLAIVVGVKQRITNAQKFQ